MIALENISKSYQKGKIPALDNVSLKIERGELFGFLGPNGAGKSTTIKILVGLLKPDKGTVFLDNINIVKNPIKAKTLVGYVPDESVAYEKMTGIQYLRFIADVFSVPESSRTLIIELADELEFRDALPEIIASYSHGMKQKLGIIAALLHEPEIFILDEPIVNLDPKSAFTVKEKMRLHCKKGKTVLFSTHIMEVAEKICDRVGIINKGKIIAVGPLEEIKQRAEKQNASLEAIFLELTNDNAHSF